MYDAINYSQNNYYGTARTMALGNAVTAVGGDLGTVGINPAGSATANYNQFVITPGLTFSAVTSSYSPSGEGNYNNAYTTDKTRFTLPNIGASMRFDTGNSHGVKSLTFSFVSNTTNNYTSYADSYGSNSMSSKLAEFATAANGIDEDILSKYSSFNMSDVSWDVLAAYQGGLIGSYGWGAYYSGNSELIAYDREGLPYHYVPGTLNQGSNVVKKGSKSDIVLNMALNIDDVLFIGGNIGLPTFRYSYSESFTESPLNVEQFPVSFLEGDTYFRSGTYAYDYIADGSGIYAKIGAIYRPTDNIRIGAAFQTPTALVIDEAWQDYARATFADPYFDDPGVNSPTGEYSYGLRTPYEFNAGVAFTLANRGFISVDYELMDYSVMKFKELRSDDIFYEDGGSFFEINEVNKKFCGISNQLRIGAELKLLPEFAIRAGYTITTSPERYWKDNSGNTVTADDYLADFNYYHGSVVGLSNASYYDDNTSTFSFGIGYSSNGSFFADFAAKFTKYPSSVFAPYYDYDGFDELGVLQEMVAPRILNERSLFDVALTFGWRF